ncbi:MULTISPECIES: Holliday junction branch migration protein RuvA [Ruminococcus]|uniref:Holliday junction branch migration complex subunit RuvA n=1 Tax=Ruminococcus flavefaciens TaxID=1265 RepID=A0A1M7GMB1_RUMFL|nr:MULTISPECIES: Holliday junction branch migration protein RuvA [Ruminococcus]MCR4795881.1 Holliday junction branch migration protein RuvA [Ruminococcus sp.]SHM17019.1 Holliday junction DNA helicase subunit RuvA [Ruminococcus flavefaciens]
MIYSVRGRLTVKELGFAVIECAGVGYGCKTSYNTISRLGEIGSEEMLYTYLYVREDVVELFGFATLQELSCFKLLISVSGVGPKAATSILSDVTPERFALLVASGDSKAFTKTKGIGAKTAQRIVLELKDKISSESISGSISGDAAQFANISSAAASSSVSEALEALMVLGYTQGETAPILGKLDPTLSTQDLIKETLRLMAAKNTR